MSNDPRGAGAQSGRSGLSPLAMGQLALLAYKTVKGQGPLGGLFGNKAAAGTTSDAGTASDQSAGGGGLTSWFQSGLGGALAGGGTGSAISGGLKLNRFQQNGLGGAVQSWIANGSNQPVSPGEGGVSRADTRERSVTCG